MRKNAGSIEEIIDQKNPGNECHSRENTNDKLENI
jgi:hypothetical protein